MEPYRHPEQGTGTDCECYSFRRLAPFRGTMQVVRAGHARALSPDARRWQLQAYTRVRQPVWGGFDHKRAIWRYVVVGTWSETQGLRRLPLDPAWAIDHLSDAAEQLAALLPRTAGRVPFAPRDRFEYWLLDDDHKPLALLTSLVEAERQLPAVDRTWRPCAGDDPSYVSPALERGDDTPASGTVRSHRDRLARLVQQRAGQPARARWFRREADGGGVALDDDTCTLSATVFPELLLCEQWQDAATARAVEDFLDWQSPWLLTLPGLRRATRRRLERAARRRPLLVEQFHRLYPEVIDATLIRAARVEATLRQSA